MHAKNRQGFTLIELLVVVAIIALLVSILLPSLGRAKDLAQTIVCANRHKGVLSGWVYYGSDFNGVYMAPWDRHLDRQWPGLTPTSCYQQQYAYTLVHYVAGGGIPSGETVWMAGAPPAGGWYSEDGRHSYPYSLMGKTAPPDGVPQMQCSVLEGQVALNPLWYSALSISYFIMGWGQEQPNLPYGYNIAGYPKPDMMTHQATTGLSMCLSGSADEGQPNCWCRFDGYPVDPHMEKSNYTFCDGHVETLSVTSTNEQMWQSLWERGS